MNDATFALRRDFNNQIKPMDPLSFIVAALLLLGVALIACYLPARPLARGLAKSQHSSSAAQPYLAWHQFVPPTKSKT